MFKDLDDYLLDDEDTEESGFWVDGVFYPRTSYDDGIEE